MDVTAEQVQQAVAIWRRGGVVGFPTETVYGLGADAENRDAVAKVFALKGRPADHPLIVHFADAGQLDDWALQVPPLARAFAARFWPGPLTLILRRSPKVPDAVTGGLETVGLRVPSHPVALALLKAFGGGIAAPSANRFGAVSPTLAEHVRAEFGSELELVVDGGPCQVGVESTIVDLSSGTPAILRPGGVTREALESVAGVAIPVREGGSVRAPGLLPSHYAPQARVELLRTDAMSARAAALLGQGLRVGALLRGGLSPAGLPAQVERLALPTEDLAAAQVLYALLRQADQRGIEVLLADLPPAVGLDLAIADRLRRAAGPRDLPH